MFLEYIEMLLDGWCFKSNEQSVVFLTIAVINARYKLLSDAFPYLIIILTSVCSTGGKRTMPIFRYLFFIVSKYQYRF